MSIVQHTVRHSALARDFDMRGKEGRTARRVSAGIYIDDMHLLFPLHKTPQSAAAKQQRIALVPLSSWARGRKENPRAPFPHYHDRERERERERVREREIAFHHFARATNSEKLVLFFLSVCRASPVCGQEEEKQPPDGQQSAFRALAKLWANFLCLPSHSFCISSKNPFNRFGPFYRWMVRQGVKFALIVVFSPAECYHVLSRR